MGLEHLHCQREATDSRAQLDLDKRWENDGRARERSCDPTPQRFKGKKKILENQLDSARQSTRTRPKCYKLTGLG